MADNKFTGMMYAYALGCLSPSDYLRLLNLITKGEEYPYQELGEFQNLTALLPSILEPEAPPKSVKENIARQLYFIKDQAKEKKVTPVSASEILQDWSTPEAETSDLTDQEEEVIEAQEEKVEDSVAEEVSQTIEDYVQETETAPEPETVSTEKETVIAPEEIEEPEEVKQPEESVPDVPEIAVVEILDDKIKQIEEELYETPKDEPVIEEEPEAPVIKEKTEVRAVPEIHVEAEVPEKEEPKKEELKKEEPKTLRSLGDFLAGAEIKPEEVTGKIEFEDYFAEAKKAEGAKREVAPPRPRVPRAETMAKDPPVMESSRRRYTESRNYRRSGSATGTIVTVLLVVLTAAVLYYYFNSELKLFKSDNEKMSGELLSMKDFTTVSKEILGILSEKDSRIFNLSGGSENAYSFGKVIYSPSENKGFIHTASLPELKENMSYQFWINVGGRNYMVHRFTSATKLDFYPFSLQRTNLNQRMRVFLTEEPYVGSESPSRTVLLSGTN